MIYKLDSGAISCHIISMFFEEYREKILDCPGVKEYFQDDFDSGIQDQIKITLLEKEEKLTIRFGGLRITHTSVEWSHIYDFKSGIIAQSEY